MANYRKTWLVNALGNKYDFTDRNSKIFLNGIDGFGFQRTYSIQNIGNSQIVSAHNIELGDITGELLFYNKDNGSVYQDYQNFIQFCKYKPLEFHYQTPNQIDNYYCDVLFTQSTKSEISYSDNIMHVGVNFHRLTQWLTDKDYKIVLTNNAITDGKQYPLERPYSYTGTGLSGTTIENVGTDDVGFIFEIDGEVQNPSFTLTQDAVQYGACKITGTYDYININSVEVNESIYLERNGSAIANPEAYQDLTIANGSTYLTWCKVKVGQTIFAFTCGNIDTFDGTITITFKNSYVSV